MQSIPFLHCRESRRSRSAQDAQEDCLREIVCMVREHNSITAPFIPYAMEKVIATDPRSRLDRESMRTRIGGHIARAENEGDLPHRAEPLHKARIRKRIRAANPMLIVDADEPRPARAPQEIQNV